MSLFCNYLWMGWNHVISVWEIFVSVEIGSISCSSEMAGEISCSVIGNTW